VGGVRHVGVDLEALECTNGLSNFGTYTTVGTVSTPALLGGLVDLDMLDDQVAGVEALGVGVGLGVLEEAEQDLSGLLGPAGAGDAESLACGSQSLIMQFHVDIVSQSHPAQCVQYRRRTASWEWPPCARGHFRGR